MTDSGKPGPAAGGVDAWFSGYTSPAGVALWDMMHENDSLPWDPTQPAPLLVRAAEKGLLAGGGAALDVGCGAGANAVFLAQQKGWTVMGLDISPAAIAMATKRATEAALSPGAVNFVCASMLSRAAALSQGSDGNGFHLVFDHLALPHLLTSEKKFNLAVAKCYAARCRPGGLCVLVASAATHRFPLPLSRATVVDLFTKQKLFKEAKAETATLPLRDGLPALAGFQLTLQRTEKEVAFSAEEETALEAAIAAAQAQAVEPAHAARFAHARYLRSKAVPALLRDLLEHLLEGQPEDPLAYIVQSEYFQKALAGERPGREDRGGASVTVCLDPEPPHAAEAAEAAEAVEAPTVAAEEVPEAGEAEGAEKRHAGIQLPSAGDIHAHPDDDEVIPIGTAKSSGGSGVRHTAFKYDVEAVDSEEEEDEEAMEAAQKEVAALDEDSKAYWQDVLTAANYSEVPGAPERLREAPPEVDPKVRVYDFREGCLPAKVQIVGPGELETLSTQATAIRLKKGAYLKVKLDIETEQMLQKKQQEKERRKEERRKRQARAQGEEPAGEEGKEEKEAKKGFKEPRQKVQQYTIIMDVKIDEAPAAPGLSLYQAAWPAPHATDECLVSPGLGVGLDDAFGQDGSVPVGKWTRVVVTVSSDTLTTYVAGKRCAVLTKKEIGVRGGRFAVDPDGVLLFASENGGASTEVSIKYFKFIADTALTPGKVKAGTYVDTLYSQWAKDRERQQGEVAQAFVLKALFRKPRPIWADPAFWGQFCDPFLRGTSLEGGNVVNLMKVLHFTLTCMLDEQAEWFGAFAERDNDRLLATALDFQRSVAFSQRALSLMSSTRLPIFLKLLRKTIAALGPRQALIIPTHAPNVLLLLVKKSASTYRFVVCQGGIPNEWHPATATLDGKLKYQGCIVIDDVPAEKIDDDTWWCLLVMTLARRDGETENPTAEDRLYTWLLPWLAGRPLQAAVAETSGEPGCAYRTPPRCGWAPYRLLLEGLRHLLLWRGLEARNVKAVTFNLRRQYLKFAINDLLCLKQLRDNDRHLIRLGCKQLAHCAVKQARARLISPFQLQTVKKDIDSIEEALAKMPPNEVVDIGPPPVLSLDTAKDRETTWFKYPLMDRLLRQDDVEGLAGPPRDVPRFIPVNLLLIPDRVTTFPEAVAALRHCDLLCRMLTEQSQAVGTTNSLLLRVAVIQHTVTRVVPVPRAVGDPQYSTCLWASPILYAQQLETCLLLRRICDQFLLASYRVVASRRLDATRLIVTGALFVMVDSLLRRLPTDIPSAISEHLLGWQGEGAFGVQPGYFAVQTETMEPVTPELVVTRTDILDYFAQLPIPPHNVIFRWEEGLRNHQSLDEFILGICRQLGWNQTSTHTWDYVTGEERGKLLGYAYPEWIVYRDMALYWKMIMADRQWSGCDEVIPVLTWEYEGGEKKFVVEIAGDTVFTTSKTGRRYPSLADPSHYTAPHKIDNESDLLHIKNLPDLDGVLNQRDSELFLSYLTVPYIRLPLVLGFFATNDRIHLLRCVKLQQALDAIVFEPQRHVPLGKSVAPVMVPSEDSRLLATPFGLLLNELHRSPQGLVASLLSLLKQGLECDSGTPYSTEVDLILYTIRLAARVETFLAFYVQYEEKTHPNLNRELRDVRLPLDTVLALRDALFTVQAVLREEVRCMLEGWIAQCVRKFREIATDPEANKEELDHHVALACRLHAHLVLVHRNVVPEEWETTSVATVLSSTIYLSNRHTWNTTEEVEDRGCLQIPEVELYECLQLQRRSLIAYLDRCTARERAEVLEAVVRITTDSGGRVARRSDIIRHWEPLAGAANAGRFGRAENAPTPEQREAEEAAERERLAKERAEREERKQKALAKELSRRRERRNRPAKEENEEDEDGGKAGRRKKKRQPRVKRQDQEGRQLDLELNLQTFQLTLRSSNLMALDSNIASDADVLQIFPEEANSMQCAVVQSAENRMWVRLVGRSHDIQWWHTEDADSAEPMLDRAYDPGDLSPEEEWIKDLFEPIRLIFYDDPFNPIPIFMPETITPRESVAPLIAVHPTKGGVIHEIYVFRHFKMVHLYTVFSYGRRFYRSLFFTTDCRFTLRELTPHAGPRCAELPPLFRFAATADIGGSTSGTCCVLFRDRVVPANHSGTDEQFIPARLLFGVVPQALLDAYHFWQDDDDHLRGYLKQKDADHYLTVTLDAAAVLDHSEIKGTLSAKVRMIPAPLPGHKSIVQQERLLLNLLYTTEGTALYSLARLIARLENLSHVLAWTYNASADASSDQLTIDLVQLPRLKLTFTTQWDPVSGEMPLYSLDHANMYVSNVRNDLVTRLCRGIPHSVFLCDPNDELRMLVPAVRVLRPMVRSSPFSTHLVLDRQNVVWMGNLETAYYLYHVHVSMSFLHNPTLASSLYLLWLRLAARDYGTAAQLVDCIGTDVEFSPEERQTFVSLGDLVDGHPNAMAIRTKVSHVVLESPLVTPWYMPDELADTFAAASHLSADCQLGIPEQQALADEAELLWKKEKVVDYIVTQKFYRSTFLDAWNESTVTQRKMVAYLQKAIASATGMSSSEAQVIMLFQRLAKNESTPLRLKCVIRNRVQQLAALEQRRDSYPVRVPPRHKESPWILKMDVMALNAQPHSWRYLGSAFNAIQYEPVNTIKDRTVIDMLDEYFEGNQVMEGKRGFLFLYELLTGKCKFGLGRQSSPRSFVFLVSQLIHKQRRRPRIMSSILEVLHHNPQLIPGLPDLHADGAKRVNADLNGSEKGVLDKLFTAVTATLTRAADAKAIIHPPRLSEFRRPPKSITALHLPPQALARTGPLLKAPFDLPGHIPRTSDFLCAARPLQPLAASDLASLCDAALAQRMQLPAAELERMMANPLDGALPLAETVVFLSNAACGLPPVSDLLEFDVSAHPDAQSTVAKEMQRRLAEDAKTYATAENQALKPKLCGLLDTDVQRFCAEGDTAAVQATIDRLQRVKGVLAALRQQDLEYVKTAIPIIEFVANHVELPPAVDPADVEDDAVTSRLLFSLRRYKEHETAMGLEFLIASLLSSHGWDDWRRLNPFLSPQYFQVGTKLLVGLLLKANRVGHISRALVQLGELLDALKVVLDAPSTDRSVVANVVQKADAVAGALGTRRHFLAGADPAFDPRFLVFEFTWNIMLRRNQVDLIHEFIASLREDRSLVKQMIMGAGKTTVVSPLLALMLADGRNLVMQVVPSALLEFSRSILRRLFSSVMRKRVFTFSFDRGSEPDAAIVRKLQNAIRTGGVVVASSVAVKSVMLKFIELLDLIDAGGRARDKEMEASVVHSAAMLRLFQSGTLMMDEVDLILHPLKSELNFPIGPRHDLDFAPLRWRLPIHLLDAVFFAERGKMSVPFKESARALQCLGRVRAAVLEGYARKALQRLPHLVLLDVDFYHRELRPLLVDWVVLFLEAQQFAGIPDSIVRRYLQLGAADAEAAAVVQATVEGREAEEAESPDAQMAVRNVKLLNLAHDWLQGFLPHVLSKINRVSFGIMNKEDHDRAMADTPNMPLSRVKLAIPFEGKDVPSRASEFAHPDTIIGLSILAYRYEGMRYADFLEVVQTLRTGLEKETGPYKQRKSNQRYEEWVREAGGTIIRRVLHEDASRENSLTYVRSGDVFRETEEDAREVVALRFLKPSNQQQMDKLYRLFRLLPDTLHWYLNEFVFPAHTPQQIVKLSASGQDVGGEMLFGRRLGFSGTPSDLLPQELGRCGYERGTDGLMMQTLQNPAIVSHTHIDVGWTVQSLLDSIAYADPPYHALIDTGALITGLSNLQVAKYLLHEGRLPGFEGVVFLDELGRKVALLRATGRVVLLEECGMALERRFAFYDQIHTTGMDIQHMPSAMAALTLGKDMTFRDYSQGAFRMRGILRGQRVRLLIIPEVRELMRREMAAARFAAPEADPARATLTEVCAWLVVNSMRTERVQFNQLCIQGVANVWRKAGFRLLLDQHAAIHGGAAPEDPLVGHALQMFREPVGFGVSPCVPKPAMLTTLMDDLQRANAAMVRTDADRRTIADIKTRLIAAALEQRAEEARREGREPPPEAEDGAVQDSDERIFNAEIVQEKAQEKEQQREQVQEVEREEFVDRMYSRDHEEPVRWPFDSLRQPTPPPNFYPAQQCSLYLRRPVQFPDYLYISDNYFNRHWSGDRRLKNVVVLLEWCPDRTALALRDPAATVPPAASHADLRRALELLLLDPTEGVRGPLDEARVRQLVDMAFDLKGAAIPRGGFAEDAVTALVCGATYRAEHANRYFVAVSLAEAETIRRIMHLRADEPSVIPDSTVGVALRCLPTGSGVMDSSAGFTEPDYPSSPPYQVAIAHQAFRWFDCDVHFLEPEINTLLKALQNSTRHARRTYFRQILACRRRVQKQWDNAPITRVFRLGNEFQLLHAKVQCLKVREALAEKRIAIYDAFAMFNDSRSGMLSLGEVNGALLWLGLLPTPLDVLDFVTSADQDEDGKVSYNEWWEAVCDPEAKLKLLDDEADPEVVGRSPSADATTVKPVDEEALMELRHRITLQREQEDAEELRRQEEEDRLKQLEAERQYDEEEAAAGRPPNPRVSPGERPVPRGEEVWDDAERKKIQMEERKKKLKAKLKAAKEKREKEEKEKAEAAAAAKEGAGEPAADAEAKEEGGEEDAKDEEDGDGEAAEGEDGSEKEDSPEAADGDEAEAEAEEEAEKEDAEEEEEEREGDEEEEGDSDGDEEEEGEEGKEAKKKEPPLTAARLNAMSPEEQRNALKGRLERKLRKQYPERLAQVVERLLQGEPTAVLDLLHHKERLKSRAEDVLDDVLDEEGEKAPYAALTYDFTTGRLPKRVVMFGFSEYKEVRKKVDSEDLKQMKINKLLSPNAPHPYIWDNDGYSTYECNVLGRNPDGTFQLEAIPRPWDEEGTLPEIFTRAVDDVHFYYNDIPDHDLETELDIRPKRRVLCSSPQGFLQLPAPMPAGNGGGAHLNQYTIHLVMASLSSDRWSGSLLLKVPNGMELRTLGGSVQAPGLAPKGYGAGWLEDNVEWSYQKGSRWVAFLQAQADLLEKEYKVNSQGSLQLQMEKGPWHCDFGQMKVMDTKAGNTYDLKRVDAFQRWQERYNQLGFTDDMLKAETGVDWAERLKSNTNWSDDEEEEADKADGAGPLTFGMYLPMGFGAGGWGMFPRRRGSGSEGSGGSFSSFGSFNWNDLGAWGDWGGFGDWSDMDSDYSDYGGGSRAGRIQQKRWHLVTVVVKCGENPALVTYVDGTQCKRYNNEILKEIDGEYSLPLASSLFVFGGLEVPHSDMPGGALQSVQVLDYAATDKEVMRAYKKQQEELERWECKFVKEVGSDSEDEDDDDNDYDEYDYE